MTRQMLGDAEWATLKDKLPRISHKSQVHRGSD